MAPAISTFGRLADTSPISKRAVSVPGCVLTCMVEGTTTGCQSVVDYICLCDSPAYTTSVMSCWNINCNATEYTAGVMYTTASCQALGVNLVPATSTGANAAVATIITVAPVVFSRAAWDIQAVMSSICSVILLLSLVYGVFSCRAQARRNGTVTTQRTWNGLPSQSDAKNNKNNSNNNNTRGAGSRQDTFGDITTVDLTRSADRRSSYKGPTTNRPNRGVGGGAGGFTNRLLPDPLSSWSEEHEMRSVDGTASAHAEGSGSGSGSGSDSDDLQLNTPRMSAQRFGRGAGAVVGGDGDDKVVPKETVVDDDRLSGHAMAGHSLAEELDERLDGDVDAVRMLSLVPEMGASLLPSTPTGTFHHASEYGSSVNLARTHSTEHGERERY